MDLYDPEWIKGLAVRMGLLNEDLTEDELILLCELFKDYYQEGTSARDALEKSIAIMHQFKNKRHIGQAG
jgi:hypothetical protein